MMGTKTRHQNNGLRKLCGCPRRQWAKCPHPWHFNFKPRGGSPYRFSLDRHLGRHVDSKTEADTEAAAIKAAILAGQLGQPVARDEMTLRQLADTYLERYVAVERTATAQAFTWALNTICRTVLPRPTGGSAPLGEWRLTDIVTDTVERFREVRRGQGTGVVGVNRNLRSLRALWNWSLRVGYLDTTPFTRHGQPIVKLSQEHARGRRLDADTDEEMKLLAVCGSHLRVVVEAALETGMRRSEILSLQWSQVDGLKVEDGSTVVTWAPKAELVLPWAKTKTRRARRIPISTRLKAILEMRRFDPAGQEMPLDGYVFGTEIGSRLLGFKRAWMTAVLKAHGHKATYTATANLTAASRAELDRIDLHFHDLRREAGSRWLEGGVPLHTIRDWLGHTSIAQTSTYLAGTIQTQHDAMRQYDARRAAALQPIATDSKTGGRKRPRSAVNQEKRPKKTKVDRQTAIM
jgi:integrase